MPAPNTTSRRARRPRAPRSGAQVVADDDGLVNLIASESLTEYYVALPGNPPGPPTLASSVSGNTVRLSWAPGAGGVAVELHGVCRVGARSHQSRDDPGGARRDRAHRECAQRPLLRESRRPQRLRTRPAVERGDGAGGTAAVHGGADRPRPAHPHHRRLRGQSRVGCIADRRRVRASMPDRCLADRNRQLPAVERHVARRLGAARRVLRARARHQCVRREPAVERNRHHRERDGRARPMLRPDSPPRSLATAWRLPGRRRPQAARPQAIGWRQATRRARPTPPS